MALDEGQGGVSEVEVGGSWLSGDATENDVDGRSDVRPRNGRDREPRKKKRALSLESVVPPHRLTVPGCPGPEQNALGHFGGTGIRVVPNLRHANGPWVSC